MNADKAKTNLQEFRINVKLLLAALWAVLLFIYLYVDIFALYKPGVIEGIIAGRVWELAITQGWAAGAMVLMTIPSAMVFLSLALPAQANRWTNLIVGGLYVIVGIGNVIGETWASYILGAVIEFVLLALILWYAWTWPRQAAGSEAERP
jgi:hypothetical protein